MDTNVFIALFCGEEEASASAQAALEAARAAGPLVISPAVYSELVAGRDASFVERFLAEKGIEVDWDQNRDAWRTAGVRYGEYARVRRRQKGDTGPGASWQISLSAPMLYTVPRSCDLRHGDQWHLLLGADAPIPDYVAPCNRAV